MAGNEDGSSDVPPEILNMEHEPYGAQRKAHQKIAEVRKLRQFYRKPEGNEERKRLIQEKMNTHPGHACGQLGHWSRECPANKPQEVLATKSRPLPAVPEATVDDGAEWALLASMCQGSKAMPASRLGARSRLRSLGSTRLDWVRRVVTIPCPLMSVIQRVSSCQQILSLLAGLDIMPVAASVLQLERDTDVRLDYLRSTHGCALGHSGVQAMQGTSQDEALPEHPEHTSLPT